MPVVLKDGKSQLSFSLLSRVNKLAMTLHFDQVQISGLENLPQSGSFLLIANHSSRWDGSVVQTVIDRPANYMVSPNEMKGMQGALLSGIGAFPALPCKYLIDFCTDRVRSGQPLVIFPEGNTFRDGSTHTFKSGAARIALAVQARLGREKFPVIPLAIKYDDGRKTVHALVGKPIVLDDYLLPSDSDAPFRAIKTLTTSLHREICHLKMSIGETADRHVIYIGKPVTRWASATMQQRGNQGFPY